MLAALASFAPILAQGEPFVRDPNDPSTECVADSSKVCIGWAIENIDRYVTPTLEHLELVVLSVGFGFAIAFAMALASHRRRWLVPPLIGLTGVLYTLPSIALFALLQQVVGRGVLAGVAALTLFTLQIIYRNVMTGLAGVPAGAKDAGRGMGMTDRQLLWRVELPLAVPEIIAGLRIATVSTVAIATLAVFANAGGLGAEIYGNITFKTGILVCGAIAIAMALLFDVIFLLIQRRLVRWRRPADTNRASTRVRRLGRPVEAG